MCTLFSRATCNYFLWVLDVSGACGGMTNSICIVTVAEMNPCDNSLNVNTPDCR